MKSIRAQRRVRLAPVRELAGLRRRLGEAEETLRAIRAGEVDAVLASRRTGAQVFTLEGAEHAYRVLIESMSEGALTLAADKTILYANHYFAHMVKSPLQKVIGSSFRRFLSVADRAEFRRLLATAKKSGVKIQMTLLADDGSSLPVQVSCCRLGPRNSTRATYGAVVTDLSEARRTEVLLRALAQRVVQGQESERGRVAVDLHDHITQLLCAILFRCEALVAELSASGGPSMREAMKLREMLGTTASEVERISHNLRPSVLDQLGLDAVLRAVTTDFADRTAVPVKLMCAKLSVRPPAETELALYRILQEALRNVQTHARASHATVALSQHGDVVRLKVSDDGIGFDPKSLSLPRKGRGGLGLLGMRERASYVGGTLEISSARGKGTAIEVNIPLIDGAAVVAARPPRVEPLRASSRRS